MGGKLAAGGGGVTPDQEIARKRKLVSAARALLSLQVGLVTGSLRISKLLYSLPPHIRDRHPSFDEMLNAIPRDLPLGSARIQWAHGPLIDSDRRLAVYENRFREQIMRECVAIIEAWGSEPTDKLTEIDDT